MREVPRLQLPLAVVLAPLVVAPAWFAVYALMEPVELSDSTMNWPWSWKYYTTIGLIGGWLMTWIVGIPAHALLKHGGLTQWWAYTGAAIALGTAGMCLTHILVTWPYVEFRGFDQSLLGFVPYTTLIALIAWVIRRPDLDPPNPATRPA